MYSFQSIVFITDTIPYISPGIIPTNYLPFSKGILLDKKYPPATKNVVVIAM